MKLTAQSRKRLMSTFEEWEVPNEYSQPMYNYLVEGWGPGSFFTAVLANDFMRAMASSHPSNTIPALKNLAGWILNYMPADAWGDYPAVEMWCMKTDNARRGVLENRKLIYTEKEETWLAIKGDD